MFTREYCNIQIRKIKKIQSTSQKSRSVATWSWRLGEVELIKRGMKKLLRGDANVLS